MEDLIVEHEVQFGLLTVKFGHWKEPGRKVVCVLDTEGESLSFEQKTDGLVVFEAECELV